MRDLPGPGAADGARVTQTLRDAYPLTDRCDEVVERVHVGRLVVPAGSTTCLAEGAVQIGAVTVEAGGGLSGAVTLAGNTTATGCWWSPVTGSAEHCPAPATNRRCSIGAPNTGPGTITGQCHRE